MDTDKIQQINTFNGGMNTDVSDALLDKNQYRLANNVRYITEDNENQGELHNIQGSAIISVFGDLILFSTQIRNYGVVMYRVKYTSDNSRNKKDIFGHSIQYNKEYVYIVRVENPYNDVDTTEDHNALLFKYQFCVFGPCEYDENIFGKKFSIVTRYEDYDNVKLYLANGVTYMLMLNIMEYCGRTVDDISMYPAVNLNTPKFVNIVDGNLKAGAVQYSYSLYKKGGRSTEISPCTKLIPIINKTNSKVNVGKDIVGLEQGTTSNSGVELLINVSERLSYALLNMLIYRIQYVENGQLPTVEIIYDGLYNTNGFRFIDIGLSAIQTLTLEEYNSLSGVHIIPRVIESKNDYLFAANIKENISSISDFDDYDARSFRFDKYTNRTHLFDYTSGNIWGSNSQSGVGLSINDIKLLSHNESFKLFDCYNKHNNMSLVLEDTSTNKLSDSLVLSGVYDCFTSDGSVYGGTGANISWKFIVKKLIGDASVDTLDSTYGAYGTSYNTTSLRDPELTSYEDGTYYYIGSDGKLLFNFRKNSCIDSTISKNNKGGRTYANPAVSYYFKSLRRDELYRYGIVMYDKYGHSSQVKWIADIRTPNMYTKGFEPFVCKEKINGKIYDLCVRSLGIEFEVRNLPKECVSYEIVRCNRTDKDICTITQGVVSRPIKKIYNAGYTGDTYSPLTPSGLLTTARYWTGVDQHTRIGAYDNEDYHEADNYDNGSVFQFISPEVCYQKDALLQLLDKKNISISPLLYLFGATGFDKYTHNNDIIKGLNVDVIHPGITNTSIRLDEADHVNIVSIPDEERHAIKGFDSPVLSLSNIYNQKLSILMDNMQNAYSFYKARFNYPYDIVNLIWYETLLGLESSRVYSAALPSLSPITNFLPNTYKNGSDIIKQYDKWYKCSKESFSYIKLYNQSNKVLLRGHVKGNPAMDAYHYNGSDYGLPTVEAKSYNKCTINDFQIAKDLGWDDLATASILNDKTTYNLKYKDLIVGIGGYNYCNWVVGGAYNTAGENLNDLRKDNGYVWHSEDRAAMMGPGGRCLLLDIDNNWEIDNNHKFVTRSENQMFTDSIGTTTITRSNGRYDTEEYTAPELSFTADLKYAEEHSFAVVSDSNLPIYSKVPIFKDSIAGTYLCNIRQDIVPYGGSTYLAITLSLYYSYGDYSNNGDQYTTVFDGDCYILPFEYVSMHKHYNNQVINTATHSIIYSIPVETNINLAYTYGNEFSSNCNKNGITNLLVEPSNVYNAYTQKIPLYSYNFTYSAQPKSRLFSSYNYLDKEQIEDTIDYRVRYSNNKDNDESIDRWTKFQAANYLDVDTRYGKVTELRTFKNKLVFFQEQATGLLSVNERTTITDDTNMPLILGTGGVLSRYDYISEKNGMKDSEFADDISYRALYWWDHDRKEICAYSDGQLIDILSKEKQILNFITVHYKNNKLLSNPTVIYDLMFNEVIFSVTDGENFNKGSLIYNENTQRFTSLYTMNPLSAILFYNQLYLCSNDSVYEWNTNDTKLNKNRTALGNYIRPYVKYVINEQASSVKVYDNQYFGGKFNDNLNYELQFTFNTPLNQTSSIDLNSITNREYDFRFAVPRNNNSIYGDRMRGKTMQCEMLSTDTIGVFSLLYIMTKFRISWS